MEGLMTRRSRYSDTIQAFLQSPELFKIADTIYSNHTQDGNDGPSYVYILDSSFNPPTRAHMHMVLSSLYLNQKASCAQIRVLLLLSTTNADKAPVPASFQERLLMVYIFAIALCEEMSARCRESSSHSDAYLAVDIGITKCPYFVDKAAAIISTNVYPLHAQQVHIIGFDTLVRLFNVKYYQNNTLQPLVPFLAKNRLIVFTRPSPVWGSPENQKSFLEKFLHSDIEQKGGKAEWVYCIQFVELDNDVTAISSTKARDAAKTGNMALGSFVVPTIKEWIQLNNLYDE